jgi:outer membrane protein assembly factor BamD (BamD/ComL family)
MRVQFTLLFCIGSFLILPLRAFSESASLNPGPRSAEEAKFLFEEGQTAISEKNYKQAIRDFKRLIERYPSDSKIETAYLSLLQALADQKEFEDGIRFSQELILRKPEIETLNQARAHLAEAELGMRHYVNARTTATELLDHHPTLKQKALAYSVRFQSRLEDKQYQEALSDLDLLRELQEKEPLESVQKLIPGFRMSLSTRMCLISHLLKDKPLIEEEILDYFGTKNLCFKTSLALASSVTTPSVISEWCESFTFFNHELQKLRADPFLKDKIAKELKNTFEFAKGLSPDLVKCYAPYQPKKSKKRHRKSTHPAPQKH